MLGALGDDGKGGLRPMRTWLVCNASETIAYSSSAFRASNFPLELWKDACNQKAALVSGRLLNSLLQCGGLVTGRHLRVWISTGSIKRA